MPIFREDPYGAFNFLVELGDVDVRAVQAGFMEVEGLDAAADVIAYRNGNDVRLAPRLLPGLSRNARVVLRRGLMGAAELQEWMDQARHGDPAAKRDIAVRLLDEAHDQMVQTWRLLGARPVALNGPRLSAMTSATAIEELVLAVEVIQAE
ncbi:MAG: phage tail protein [Alphaproteobacteria bacterium]